MRIPLMFLSKTPWQILFGLCRTPQSLKSGAVAHAPRTNSHRIRMQKQWPHGEINFLSRFSEHQPFRHSNFVIFMSSNLPYFFDCAFDVRPYKKARQLLKFCRKGDRNCLATYALELLTRETKQPKWIFRIQKTYFAWKKNASRRVPLLPFLLPLSSFRTDIIHDQRIFHSSQPVYGARIA